jgi:hypothetical protein
MTTGHRQYVVCPKCGDAIAGRLPSGDEPRQLQCIHCREKVELTDSEIKLGADLLPMTNVEIAGQLQSCPD